MAVIEDMRLQSALELLILKNKSVELFSEDAGVFFGVDQCIRTLKDKSMPNRQSLLAQSRYWVETDEIFVIGDVLPFNLLKVTCSNYMLDWELELWGQDID